MHTTTFHQISSLHCAGEKLTASSAIIMNTVVQFSILVLWPWPLTQQNSCVWSLAHSYVEIGPPGFPPATVRKKRKNDKFDFKNPNLTVGNELVLSVRLYAGLRPRVWQTDEQMDSNCYRNGHSPFIDCLKIVVKNYMLQRHCVLNKFNIAVMYLFSVNLYGKTRNSNDTAACWMIRGQKTKNFNLGGGFDP